MSFQHYLLDAFEMVFGWDLPDEAIADAAIAQAGFMAKGKSGRFPGVLFGLTSSSVRDLPVFASPSYPLNSANRLPAEDLASVVRGWVGWQETGNLKS